MAALVADTDYQAKFRQAFIRRRLHPTTEIKVWKDAIGKPVNQIEVSRKMSMDDRLAADRALFALLNVEDLAELAEQSDALITRAREMAQRRHVPPAAATLPGAPMDNRNITTSDTAQNTGDVDDL